MLPNVARYQLRHTPKCEKYSIFRSFSVSGQICGQNILSVFFWKGKQPKKWVFTRVFSQWLQGFSWLCFSRGARFCPRGRPRCLHAPKRRALPVVTKPLSSLLRNSPIGKSLPLLIPRFITHRVRSETSPTAPHPEVWKILNFRSFSASGQTCGQTAFIEDFAREQSAEEVSSFLIFLLK